MESDWRWTVSDIGMADSDWELCARVLILPPSRLFIVKRTGNPRPECWKFLGPGLLPVYQFDFPLPLPGTHFPYGWPVLPD